jgi:hypothetical protein
MNKLILLLEKVTVSILIIIMYIDTLEGVNLPEIAYYIPLLIIGAMRSFIISLVLIMNLSSLTYETVKRIFRKRNIKL